jgi:hypothetical protein
MKRAVQRHHLHMDLMSGDYERLRLEMAVNFVVVPIGRQPSFGFWLQADSAQEARRLVALNVPSMGSAGNPDLAECRPDQTYSPGYGAIVQGTGRTYTITRRSDHANRT